MTNIVKTSVLCSLILAFFSISSYAQPANIKAEKEIAITSKVIMKAHKIVQETKQHERDLKTAKEHQKFAKVLLRKKKFVKAIKHTKFARKNAVMAIKKNKKPVKPEFQITKEDNEEIGNEEELVNELEKSNSESEKESSEETEKSNNLTK